MGIFGWNLSDNVRLGKRLGASASEAKTGKGLSSTPFLDLDRDLDLDLDLGFTLFSFRFLELVLRTEDTGTGENFPVSPALGALEGSLYARLSLDGFGNGVSYRGRDFLVVGAGPAGLDPARLRLSIG